jgi:hypothetical protein
MLKQPSVLQKCMKTVNWILKWTIIIKACKYWIFCGEYEGKATIVSLNFKAALCSELNLKMTCNGFKGKPNMLCLKTAIIREKKAIVLATERDGWCHLISISVKGRLMLLQSILFTATKGAVYPDNFLM